MTPIYLRLKGFSGIQSGLGRETFELDFSALPDDARLIALVGQNGVGKSTVLDNLHPYRIMPSRASGLSVAGFSYYDHLCSAEAEKALRWRQDGRVFRSSLVWRINGKRKCEAYLHEEKHGQWLPVQTPDGVRSDGKTDTYDTCVESILGNAETFFTSVFAAQNRRQLAGYSAGEVKSLMVELLGLDDIRVQGEQANLVVRLLKFQLEETRRSWQVWEEKKQAAAQIEAALTKVKDDLRATELSVTTAQRAIDATKTTIAQKQAAMTAAAGNEKLRSDLLSRRGDMELRTKRESEGMRSEMLRWEAGLHRGGASLQTLQRDTAAGIAKCQGLIDAARNLLKRRGEIEDARRRLGPLEREIANATQLLALARERDAERLNKRHTLDLLAAQVQAFHAQAGEAALRNTALKQRLGLTQAVPCQGLPLQANCQLLGDAHAARALIPSAEAALQKIELQVQELDVQKAALRQALETLGDTAPQVKALSTQLDALTAERGKCERLAAEGGRMEDAGKRLDEWQAQQAHLKETLDIRAAEIGEEAQHAKRQIKTLQGKLSRLDSEADLLRRQFDQQLRALPPAGDRQALGLAQSALQDAEKALEAHQARRQALVQAQGGLLEQQRSIVEAGVKAERILRRCGAMEKELGHWQTLARGLGNDGVIALCIDGAGPELTRLANALLLSCYGPRFTLSIQTQVLTAKQTLKEGFDIQVFDGESGKAQSLTVMSGGERVWLNECLTRAVALYLAQHSGRRFSALFSDEADGPLDMGHKRMFMQMKKQVLELGGYEREFFITQTPELAECADVQIDLVAVAAKQLAQKSFADNLLA